MPLGTRANRERWLAIDWNPPEAGSSPQADLPEWARTSGAWFSNGGDARGHRDRGLPYSLQADLPAGLRISRLCVVGVFAKHASREQESAGTIGASLALTLEGRQTWRLDLVNGRHYQDARVLGQGMHTTGDGAEILEIGTVDSMGQTLRVDQITIDLPQPVSADRISFKDLGSPASFGIFDWAILPMPAASCPFHSAQGGGVALSEIPGILRLGDRARFAKAMQLLDQSIKGSSDLDEAKGEALTFLAIVTATSLEMGGGREMHRMQLDAARALDALQTQDEVAHEIGVWLDLVSGNLFEPRSAQGTAKLVDRALAILDRNFARDLTDEEIADAIGLSTSHFRFLFRQATGQPFNKYLVSLRLEKARALLVGGDLSVGAVASAVGFTSLSHFSRAFAQRFSVSPGNLRRAAN